MYWYTVLAAKKINSASLKADAWHHRSDALSSVGSFVGILGARMGFPILDPIASVLICLMIIKVSYDIVRDAIDKLVDKSCDGETIRRMQTVIMEQEGVEGVDLLKTRLFGSKFMWMWKSVRTETRRLSKRTKSRKMSTMRWNAIFPTSSTAWYM